MKKLIEATLAEQSIQEKIITLKELIKIQCSNGNWDYDPYMQGMANGMILAESIFTDTDPCPRYLNAPEVWLKDIPSTGKPIISESKHKSLIESAWNKNVK